MMINSLILLLSSSKIIIYFSKICWSLVLELKMCNETFLFHHSFSCVSHTFRKWLLGEPQWLVWTCWSWSSCQNCLNDWWAHTKDAYSKLSNFNIPEDSLKWAWNQSQHRTCIVTTTILIGWKVKMNRNTSLVFCSEKIWYDKVCSRNTR